MNTDQLLLIDLSALAHQIWHVSGSEPDPNYVSNQIVARVRALSTEHPHAAICCDAPPYLRKEIDPSYKATRPESIAPLLHQMQVARERLASDGYPVWRVTGFEADDIIATAVRLALEIDGASVLIASSDKDLLQLVGPNVTAKNLTTGKVVDEAAVVEKFGVRPDQMLDYLCLVGDTSDNVVGAKGIGAVTAAKLLKEHDSLGTIYANMAQGIVRGMTVSQRTSLAEFQPRWPVVRALITLREDVDIPFEEIAAERTAPAMTEETEVGIYQGEDYQHAEAEAALEDRELSGAEVTAQLRATMEARRLEIDPAAQKNALNGLSAGGAEHRKTSVSQAADGYAIPSPPASLVPYQPVDFSQQLEPRNMDDAVKLAQRMFESRLFSAYGTPQAVLATVLAGRELGIQAMASLRAFHIIEGKPTLSAGAIQSLVIKSGKARYFRCTERTNERATFATQRGDDPEMTLTITVEDGRRAWPKDDAAFAKSGWGKNPADMCVARAATKLARLVYPDVVSGLYAPEEME